MTLRVRPDSLYSSARTTPQRNENVIGYFPNTYTAATLTEALSFKTQQGTRGPVVAAGTEIKVRYDDHNGVFNASAVVDGKPVFRKDIPLRTFNWK